MIVIVIVSCGSSSRNDEGSNSNGGRSGLLHAPWALTLYHLTCSNRSVEVGAPTDSGKTHAPGHNRSNGFRTKELLPRANSC